MTSHTERIKRAIFFILVDRSISNIVNQLNLVAGKRRKKFAPFLVAQLHGTFLAAMPQRL